MTDPSLIADLIRAGVDPELVGRVANALASMSSTGHRVDSVGDKRRAWDRERKRATRDLRLPDHEWYPLVAEVLKRDGGKCTYCGAQEKLTADHVVPMSRGGTHDLSNLTACCLSCNSKKSNKLLCEWLPPNRVDSTVFHPTVKNALTIEENIEVKKERKSDRPESGGRKGSRIPPDWNPSPADRLFAISKGMSGARINTEAEKFRNYWTAKSGAAATKLDWAATWRNWVLSSLERTPPENPPTAAETTGPPKPPDPSMPSDEELRRKYGAKPDDLHGRTPSESGGVRGASGKVREGQGSGGHESLSRHQARIGGMASMGTVLSGISGLRALGDASSEVRREQADDGPKSMA
jgi:5-methylcytosine-specific restriction endonuclease McrA